MGLLSKILGNAAQQTVKRAVNNAVGNAVGNAVSNAVNSALNGGRPAQSGQTVTYQNRAPEQPAYDAADEPSGFSWGPVMPAEENQFNYPGSYVEYFAHVFREGFPEYRVTHEPSPKRPATVFTLWSGGSRALVVELLPEGSETKRLRKECAAQGVPYLRFYYNHDGWWNTRAYVDQRVRTALGR